MPFWRVLVESRMRKPRVWFEIESLNPFPMMIIVILTALVEWTIRSPLNDNCLCLSMKLTHFSIRLCPHIIVYKSIYLPYPLYDSSVLLSRLYHFRHWNCILDYIFSSFLYFPFSLHVFFFLFILSCFLVSFFIFYFLSFFFHLWFFNIFWRNYTV